MVSDLRNNIQEPTTACKAGQKQTDELHATFISHNFQNYLKEKQTIIDYIKNQKEHHKKVSFEEEYRQFLIENGIDIDERYLLKD